MLKKLLFIPLFLIIAKSVEAQLPYTFTKDSITYSELSAGSKTVIETTWQYPFTVEITTQAIGMYFFNQPTDENFTITSKGQVMFTGYYSGDQIYASGMGSEMVGFAFSQIGEASYEVDGISPDKILKVQFKNVDFSDDAPNQNEFNFQVWLYQTSNIVEYRYGSSTLSGNLNNEANIGIFDVHTTTTNSIALYGAPSNPTANNGDYNGSGGMTGYPAANTVYRFTPVPTLVPQVSNENDVVTSYVPSQSAISVKTTGSGSQLISYELYSVSGQKVKTAANLNTANTTISISDLAAGIYVLKVTTNNNVVSKKILLNK